MKIEILGTGCSRCNALESAARAAVHRLGLECEIEHVTDVREFARRGVLFTPALAVDGKVLVAGKVPGEPEIAQLLTQAKSENG